MNKDADVKVWDETVLFLNASVNLVSIKLLRFDVLFSCTSFVMQVYVRWRLWVHWRLWWWIPARVEAQLPRLVVRVRVRLVLPSLQALATSCERPNSQPLMGSWYLIAFVVWWFMGDSNNIYGSIWHVSLFFF